MDWWELPGPASFVDDVADRLRRGLNLHLRLPRHHPEGLRRAVRTRLPDADGWLWESWTPPGGTRLEEAAFEALLAPRPPGTLRTASDLARASELRGRVVWIHDDAPDGVEDRRRFLVEYAHACRQIPVEDRGMFCVVAEGESARYAIDEDVCLADLAYDATVSFLDAAVFAHDVLRPRSIGRLDRRTAAAVIACVAQWDPEVALRLSGESLDRILRPRPVLVEIARERGWSAESGDWADGVMFRFDGEVRRHSACAPDTEIESSVWRGQVGILLPFVEERRIELIQNVRGRLRVPFVTRFGEAVVEAGALELGHIEHQMRERRQEFRPGEVDLVAVLRGLRNDLAHGRPIEAARLRASALGRWNARESH